ncbi:MAG: hypothetical protein HYU88_11610, partial [Chloroflexi bacterium]|nr:hypothetical protein [Chloroflexota bacterium]
VDNLGALFGRGLGPHATASRVSTLSFFLRLFFEGWLNDISATVERDPALRAAAPTGGLLYSIYCGGDDVFIVGAWDRMPLLAQRINDDLHAFAAKNARVHASAGIALVAADYPLYRAADDARAALEKAKDFSRPDGAIAGAAAFPDEAKKRALGFLDHTLGWEDVPAVRDAVDLVWGLLRPRENGEAPVPRALLRVCGEVAEAYRAAEDAAKKRAERSGAAAPRKIVWGRWLWLQVYALSRLAERTRPHDAAAAEALLELQRRLSAGDHPLIPHLGLVARWVELLLRERSDDGGR